MGLNDNPIYKKVSEKEQYYKYLRLLFEDLESLKFQVGELQKDLQIKDGRIRLLEDELKKR